jgi:hypothetical protein
MAVANTPAYYNTATIMALKSFIVQAQRDTGKPGMAFVKLLKKFLESYLQVG